MNSKRRIERHIIGGAPRIIGHWSDGSPIFSVAGGDGTDTQYRSLEELRARREELVRVVEGLDAEYEGRRFPDDVKSGWNDANRELEEIDAAIPEMERRLARIRELGKDPKHTAPYQPPSHGMRGDPEVAPFVVAARDQALRAVERHDLSPEAGDRLSDTLRNRDAHGITARYVSAVSNPAYRSAFGKLLLDPTTGHLRFSAEEVEAFRRVEMAMTEQRALSLTGSAGGFAVPFELDPTILLTSDGAVNPIREIARVEQIGVDEWRGVSSAGVTAAFAAEATETTDNAPTLAQPTVSTEKAQAFIPFSIEIGMDWGSLTTEIGRLLADAKDVLEADKFVNGSGTNEPFGVLTGTTNTVPAATGADAFTSANVYSLSQALPPRFRARGAYIADLAILNRIDQFETANGAKLFSELGEGRLLRKPIYEASAMPDNATTGNKFLGFGDFSRYLVADRIGLTIELIPHLVGTNHRPTGQRGIYAFWRVGAKVLDASAFRALLGTA